ncbi:PREDICTED: probable G-protein coupled receptor 157 [Amphimedon queenslandica]|uniref:G-protein coupled receptors family 2 profile 2 domain-containing protein n=1 Tax=Amphimedon queenslandica TaxID=400682 RepID=A0A1X7UQJ5_AMPQE|nr:PREDICTED: probable G-protein coupled receptor 157 [Amphimedon queenslandica]|eukprot:XP_019852968.1 PREDICTED: probable G-protein coupled receptor 157 [Amphimedon queenslandica]
MISNNSDYPSWSINSDIDSAFYKNDPILRGVVIAACILSGVGALLVIFSYVCSRQLRSQARLIILHLSFMDFGVALANFIGLSVYFNKYYLESYKNEGDFDDVTPVVRYSCMTQAIVAVYCNNSSILWTLSVAIYLYFRIVTNPHSPEKFFRILLYIMYAVNYGLPLVLTIWLALTKRLGFSPFDSSGWCSLITYRYIEMESYKPVKVDVYASFFGNDMLIILTLITIPVLYFSIKRNAKKQLSSVATENLRHKLNSIELKFTAIPLVFLFLRLWSLILSIMYDYAQVDDKHVPQKLKIILLYLSGIGDSSQGTANSIIFIFFTEKARSMLCALFCCFCTYFLKQTTVQSDMHEDSQEKEPILTNSTSHQEYKAKGQTLYIIQSH